MNHQPKPAVASEGALTLTACSCGHAPTVDDVSEHTLLSLGSCNSDQVLQGTIKGPTREKK